jgi:hypothetical protein
MSSANYRPRPLALALAEHENGEILNLEISADRSNITRIRCSVWTWVTFLSFRTAMHASTIGKGRWFDGWNINGMMVKSRWCDDTMVKIISRSHHQAIAVSLSYNRVFTIVPSRFHHRVFVDSPSFNRFTFLPSCFQHRNIAISSSYYRAIALSSLYNREQDSVCLQV